METLFPAAFTWATVLTGITGLVANPVVIGGLGFVLALRFGPKAVGALKRMVR